MWGGRGLVQWRRAQQGWRQWQQWRQTHGPGLRAMGKASVEVAASSTAATGTVVAAGGAAEVDTKHNKAAGVRKETACKVEMGGASTGTGAVATSGAAAGMANWGAMAGPAEGGAAVAGAAAEDAAVAPKKKGKTRGGKKLQPGHQRHRNKKE